MNNTSKTFQVLYYKRKNKVHKTKGVSKMDGLLIVTAPPTSLIKLIDAEAEAVVYSNINADVAKRVFGESGLQLDDVVALPQFECQVTGLLKHNDGSGDLAKEPLAKKQKTIPLKSRIPAPLQSKYLLTRKNGIIPPKLSLTVKQRSLDQPRSLPHQPKVPALRLDKENVENNIPYPSLLRKQLAHPLLSKKRTLVNANTSATALSTMIVSFPGAIGTINIPHSIHKVIRPHQVSGVSFLWNVLTGSSPALNAAADTAQIDQVRGCILADEPGIGKTLQSIAVLCALHRRNKDDRFIVVCPSSLVSNWAKEFDKWIGRASSPKRVVVKKGGEEGLQQIKAFLTVKPNRSEVLIISFDFFRMNAALLQHAKQIGLLVVDEGHRLKNSAGSQTLSALTSLDCEARLLITGTPIQNKLSEFHAVVSFVCPGILGDLASFRRLYEHPINAANTKSASWQQRADGQARSQALDAITKTFMLRRLQKDILKSMLPPRMELLLFCKPSSMQCDLYKAMTKCASTGGQSADALTLLTNLRKLCSHPGLLDENASTEKSLSGKIMVLDSLLQAIRKENPDDKIIIVSNFTSALTVIHDSILKPRKLSFQRLDGTVPLSDRQPMVDSFNRSTPAQCFAFLLSSKAGGCGLNLVGANRLVMFDADFNPAIDQQAMARVYRPGQTKPCFVYRFFTVGTVEEVIYQRQHQKGYLSTITVDGASCTNQSAGFTKEELKDCFTLKENCDCETKIKVGDRWPDYSGATGLEDEGCTDQPILTVAKNQRSVLRFIHIVNEPLEVDNICFDPKELGLSDDNSDNEDEFMNKENEEKAKFNSSSETESSSTSGEEAEFED